MIAVIFEVTPLPGMEQRYFDHRAGQAEGRVRVFADYRIRVAQVVRDYTQTVRDQAPHDSNMALHVKE